MKLMTTLVAPLALPLTVLAESITHTLTYDYSKLTIGTDTLGGVTYSTVSYEGLRNGGEPGVPSLPVDYIRFSVPYNATNFTVSATTRFPLESNFPYLVYPCQAPRLMNDTSAWPVTLPDSSIYFSGSYYPANLASLIDEGFLAGENHIVTVAVTPFSCLHVNNGIVNYKKIRKPQSITVKLTYQTGGPLQTEPIVRRDTVLRNEGFEVTRSMVVNPNDVRTNAVPDTSSYIHLHGIVSTGQSYPVDSTATYLIVTTQELKHPIRRLAALKRQQGYSVKIVTMDEVLASPFSGNGDWVENSLTYQDDAGKLREYIRYCFKYLATKYVLLAGTDVPYRIIDLFDPLLNIPTDTYYSALNSNWNINNWHSSSTKIDFEPEIYVGRFLSKSKNQVNNQIDKTFRYILNPGHGDFTYLNKAFFLEGRDFIDVCFNTQNCLSAYFPNQITLKDTTDNNVPTGKNVIDTIRNNRFGFLCLFNHGDTARIRVYGTDSLKRKHFIYAYRSLSNGDGLNSLDNKYYPMIFYAPSCTTIPYNNVNGINFGESFTTGKDYGGPVYIGYTAKVFQGEITKILETFADYLRDGKVTLGEADAHSKTSVSTKNEPIAHAYLGDPSLEIWTGVPQLYENISVERTNNSITVSGITVDSTYVIYCGNDGTCLKTISSSTVSFNQLSPNGSIMLFKRNYLPYIAPLALQNTTINNNQYVIANEVTAGNTIDINRTSGDVVIPNGVEYEIEASGTVTLNDGFNVEKGATFAVYPSCF